VLLLESLYDLGVSVHLEDSIEGGLEVVGERPQGVLLVAEGNVLQDGLGGTKQLRH
jgi:hypothetical protein